MKEKTKAAEEAAPATKIDWASLLAKLLKVLEDLFGGPTPPAEHALRAAIKAAGCPDDDLDPCCACMKAAGLALQSAKVSLECCQAHCQT